VDLNADLGEGFGRWTLGDDDALLDVVTSANVACGFHAGDPSIMQRVCAAAAERGVTIGAQVGYRDLAGFGRRFIDVAPGDLEADVLYQIGALDAFARIAGARVAYVKPHGALYNALFSYERQAEAVVAAVLAYDQELVVLGQPKSILLKRAAAAGLNVVAEAFADRAYNPDGTLVDRREAGAVLHDEDEVAGRAAAFAISRYVIAVDGSPVAVDAGSICVHGDTDGAVRIVRAVRTALEEAGIDVAPFVR
jgi:5-oxoprolinase (ATP-hydrolysing) subunit A